MERGVKNHSLGFQDSFMEGKWRKASEKAEKGGFWRKKRKNITSNSRVFVWSGQNEMQREIQSQKLTLRTSGWVRWSVFFCFVCLTFFEHLRSWTWSSHSESSLWQTKQKVHREFRPISCRRTPPVSGLNTEHHSWSLRAAVHTSAITGFSLHL